VVTGLWSVISGHWTVVSGQWCMKPSSQLFAEAVQLLSDMIWLLTAGLTLMMWTLIAGCCYRVTSVGKLWQRLDVCQECFVSFVSAVSLASKCSTSAFRMHIRAHDTFMKMLSALHDAAQDPVCHVLISTSALVILL